MNYTSGSDGGRGENEKKNKVPAIILVVSQLVVLIYCSFFSFNVSYKFLKFCNSGPVYLFAVNGLILVFGNFIIFKSICRKIKITLNILFIPTLFLGAVFSVPLAFCSQTTNLKNYMLFDEAIYKNNDRFNYVDKEEGITFFPKKVEKTNVDYDYFYNYDCFGNHRVKVMLREKYMVLSEFNEVKNSLYGYQYKEIITEQNWEIIVIDKEGAISWAPNYYYFIGINVNTLNIIYVYENYYDYNFEWSNGLLFQK